MNLNNEPVDPYINIRKGLNDEDLWKAMIKRIDEIDETRRSIRHQINISKSNAKANRNAIDTQWLNDAKENSAKLASERIALHEEMKKVKERIKRVRRERNGRPAESLAIEFMLIAQKKLSENIFAVIRDEAAMNIASYKN